MSGMIPTILLIISKQARTKGNMKCSTCNIIVNWLGVFLAVSLLGAMIPTSVVATSASSSSSQSNLRRELESAKLDTSLARNATFIAHSDCTIQVIASFRLPDADSLTDDDIYLCELDPADAPGGYTGLLRDLGLTHDQNLDFKMMWNAGKLIPGKSKLKISKVIEGVLFDSQNFYFPLEFNFKKAVQRDGGTDKQLTNGLFSNLQTFGNHIGNKPVLVVKVVDVVGLLHP
jgi:hypothetical protein